MAIRKMVKILILIVCAIEIQYTKFISADWNPSVDECNFHLNGFHCMPTMDGNKPIDQSLVEEDTNYFLREKNRGEIVRILSMRNFRHREAIESRFYNKNPDHQMLYAQYQASDIPIYTKLLFSLLNSVSDQYTLFLWEAASTSPDTGIHDMHDTTPFMAILGGLSNKGLRHLNEALQPNEENAFTVSFETRMRTIGLYPENFIKLINQLLKGERDESTEIDDELYKSDLEQLKNNLELVMGERDKDETFLCELLTKRSLIHLRKLFSEESTKDFANKFTEITDDYFMGGAIVELYSATFDRIKALTWILYIKKDSPSPFLFNMLIVTRSEIDLRNIKDRYEMESEESLSDVIGIIYHGLPMTTGPLLNLLNPPVNFAWKRDNELSQLENEVGNLSIQRDN